MPAAAGVRRAFSALMTRMTLPALALTLFSAAAHAQTTEPGLPLPGSRPASTPAPASAPSGEVSPFLGTWALRGSTSTQAGALTGHLNTRVRLVVTADPAGGLQVERRWRVTLPGNAQRALVATARGVRPDEGSHRLRFELVLDGRWVEGLAGAIAGEGRTVARTNRLRVTCWLEGAWLREEVTNETRVAPEHFWSSSRCEGTRLAAEDLAPAPSRVTLVRHGPASKRYDLTIVADGYTPDELPVFHRDAREVVERLRATSPFKEYWSYLNVHRADIVSARPGLSHGERGALGTTMPVRTPWNDRLVRWNEGRILDTVPGSDAVLVIADDDFRSAAAEGFCVASAWPDDVGSTGLRWGSSRLPETAVHELGHTIGGLLDEYDDPHPYASGDERGAPSRWRRIRNGFEELGLTWTGWGGNVTSDPHDLPWRHWVGSPQVGAHEGAYHQARGWYRPTPSCLMRDTTADFCVVCRELLVRALSRRTVPVHVVKVRLDANTWRLALYPSIPGGKARFRWLRNGFEVGSGSTFIARRADTWHQDELVCDVQDAGLFVRDDPDGDTTVRVRFRLTRRADLRLEGPAFE